MLYFLTVYSGILKKKNYENRNKILSEMKKKSSPLDPSTELYIVSIYVYIE